MLRSIALGTVTLLALATPAPVQAASAPAPDRTATSITGTWKGAVKNQDGPLGYTGRVHIRRTTDGYTATARYTSRHGVLARTRWVYREHVDGWFVFRERSRDGKTVTPTTVKARRDGARLIVRWRDQAGYTGHMRARRA
jgi:hypothetical protein